MGKHIAIIGSGPSAIYVLKHLHEHASEFRDYIKSITIFEKSPIGGMGMPYHPEMTDIYNLSNISSEEIPMLEESFASWLTSQPCKVLESFNIEEFPISKSKVYSRIALGFYFKSQYDKIIANLRNAGFVLNEYFGVNIIDILPQASNKVNVLTSNSQILENFSNVIIATGHIWSEKDHPENKYYGSPWPIHKLLPDKNTYFNFTIGILGASLSAFDVVTSLAHRHGTFHKTAGGLSFKLDPLAKKFKIVLHSAEGWLPHLQYEQEKPIREIYRHTDRQEILALIDTSGFLPLDSFFDKICRPALIEAFIKDKNDKLIVLLSQPSTGILEFVEHMEHTHEYVNCFEGMRKEFEQAKEYMDQNKPTHWMETLDDLMYCLNFHAELLAAEDHLFFRKQIMPFLMNVIAALPLPSATILLALYDAGCIELVKGKVEILEASTEVGKTTIQVSNSDEATRAVDYAMFINCAGQGKIAFEDYPFPTLITNGNVRKARAKFKTPSVPMRNKSSMSNTHLFIDNEVYAYTGGIDVDSGYSVIDSKGNSDTRIHDVSFIHTAGCRPYSYGLQACNATSLILVEQLKRNCTLNAPIQQESIETTTRIYENNPEL
jgi:uncharacterized NAD(P)/FAD-binding protein YdhS